MEADSDNQCGRDGDVFIREELGVARSEDTEADTSSAGATTLEGLCAELCFSVAMMIRESNNAEALPGFAADAGYALAEVLSLFLIPRAHEVEPPVRERKFLFTYRRVFAGDSGYSEQGPFQDTIQAEDEDEARRLFMGKQLPQTLTSVTRIDSVEEVK